MAVLSRLQHGHVIWQTQMLYNVLCCVVSWIVLCWQDKARVCVKVLGSFWDSGTMLVCPCVEAMATASFDNGCGTQAHYVNALQNTTWFYTCHSKLLNQWPWHPSILTVILKRILYCIQQSGLIKVCHIGGGSVQHATGGSLHPHDGPLLQKGRLPGPGYSPVIQSLPARSLSPSQTALPHPRSTVLPPPRPR